MCHKYQHDLFFVCDKLRQKGINPRFLSLIEQTYQSHLTLTPELLRDFRRVAYRHLRIWFVAPWTESIPVLEPAAYAPCQKLEGNHVFYTKSGRRKEPRRPGYRKAVARGVAEYNDRQLDRQFLNSIERDGP
jgi:hypothetical protein